MPLSVGIGYETAVQFGARGAAVVLTARSSWAHSYGAGGATHAYW
jgi:NAD(P)-dependent dehydrogenase (short-subunit alcohol dehydrogenase family)